MEDSSRGKGAASYLKEGVNSIFPYFSHLYKVKFIDIVGMKEIGSCMDLCGCNERSI